MPVEFAVGSKYAAARIARVLLVGGFGLAAWVTWLWMTQNRPLYVYDPADHLNEAAMFARHPLDYLEVINMWWAPLYHMLLGFMLWLTDGAVRGSIALVNLGFLALLVWSTFKIGESLHSAMAGVVSIFILMSYPAIFIHVRHPMIDLPLTALTSVTVMALMKCGRFENRSSALVGVVGGLGMLTKQSFASALLLPAAYSVSHIRSRRGVAHAALALALALAIALPFYYPRLGFYLGYWRETQTAYGIALGHLGPATQFGLVSELIGIWHQTSLGLAVAWLVALPGFLRSEHRAVTGFWFLGTLAFATSVPVRDTRYLMPALPAMALMTSVGLMRGRLPALAIAGTLGFGALQLWAVSFDSPWWPRGVAVSNGVEPAEPFQFFTRAFNLLGPPSPDPDGLGVANGLAEIGGRVGVFGDRIVRDAITSQHAAPRGSPRVESISFVSSCTDASLPQLDYVVWQVGGPSAPNPEWSPTDCLAGFQPVRSLKVTRPEFMLGTRELLILARRLGDVSAPPPCQPGLAPSSRLHGLSTTLSSLIWAEERPLNGHDSGGAPLRIEHLAMVRAPNRIELISLTVRNTTNSSQRGSAFYVVGDLKQPEPWHNPRFMSARIGLHLGPRQACSLSFTGTPVLEERAYTLSAWVHIADAADQGERHSDGVAWTNPIRMFNWARLDSETRPGPWRARSSLAPGPQETPRRSH